MCWDGEERTQYSAVAMTSTGVVLLSLLLCSVLVCSAVVQHGNYFPSGVKLGAADCDGNALGTLAFYDNQAWVCANVTGVGPTFLALSGGSGGDYNALAQRIQQLNNLDTVAPVVTLNGAPVITYTAGVPFVDPGATAVDTVDGNVAASMRASDLQTFDDMDAIATQTSYPVTYEAQDVSGNVGTVSRTFHIASAGGHYATAGDPQLPCLSGDYQDGIGATTCKACPQGQYSSTSAATSCTNAGTGKFATHTLVSYDTFEDAQPAGWTASGSTASNSIQTCGRLGRIMGGYNAHASGTLSKTFNITALAGRRVTGVIVEVDIIAVDSWDHESAAVYVDGHLVHSESFFFQDAVFDYCGNTATGYNDQVYRVSAYARVDNPDAMQLSVSCALSSVPDDESMGIDNVAVYVPMGQDEDCGLGETSNPGASTCTLCPPGWYFDRVASATDCVPSPTGSYAPQTVIVNEDFTSGSTTGWTSDGSVGVSDCGGNNILGGFGVIAGGYLQKTYNITALAGSKRTKVHIEFDYYEGDSWDNEAGEVRINDEYVDSFVGFYQNPGSHLCGHGSFTERIRHFAKDIHLTGDLLTLRASSLLDSVSTDESFGLDNIIITVGAAQPIECSDGTVTTTQGLDSCSCCSPGQYASAEHNACLACPQGYTSEACATSCDIPVCGDGLRVNEEACDDANTASNDGCSATCTAIESGFSCSGGTPVSRDSCSCITLGTCTLHHETYSDNNVPAGWTSAGQYSALAITTCGSLGKMLGGYNQFSVGYMEKTFVISPVHSSVTIAMDLQLVDSWDTENVQILVDGSSVFTKTYKFTGSNASICGGAYNEQTDPISITVPHSAATLTLRIVSGLNSAPNDESLGVSNLRIIV